MEMRFGRLRMLNSSMAEKHRARLRRTVSFDRPVTNLDRWFMAVAASQRGGVEMLEKKCVT